MVRRFRKEEQEKKQKGKKKEKETIPDVTFFR